MAARTGSKFLALCRQGWEERPDLMFSLGMAIAGLGFTCGLTYKRLYIDTEMIWAYKKKYLVIRPEDKDPDKPDGYYN